MASIHNRCPIDGYNIHNNDRNYPESHHHPSMMPQSASWNALQTSNRPTSPLVVVSPSFSGHEGNHPYPNWMNSEHTGTQAYHHDQQRAIMHERFQQQPIEKQVQSPVHRLKAKIANSRGSSMSSEGSIAEMSGGRGGEISPREKYYVDSG